MPPPVDRVPPLLTSRPPATTRLGPPRSTLATLPAWLAPTNVRLPPLRNTSDEPTLVSTVGTACVPGARLSVPYDWKFDTFTVLPAPTLTVPLPWFVTAVMATGPDS